MKSGSSATKAFLEEISLYLVREEMNLLQLEYFSILSIEPSYFEQRHVLLQNHKETFDQFFQIAV